MRLQIHLKFITHFIYVFSFFLLRAAFVSLLSLRKSLPLSQICAVVASYHHADKCEIKWNLTIDLKRTFAFIRFVSLEQQQNKNRFKNREIPWIVAWQAHLSYSDFSKQFCSVFFSLLLSIACQRNRLSSPHSDYLFRPSHATKFNKIQRK